MDIGYFTLHDPEERLSRDLSFTGKIFSLKDGFVFEVTSPDRAGLFGFNCRTRHRNYKLLNGAEILEITPKYQTYVSVVYRKQETYFIGDYCPTGKKKVWTKMYTLAELPETHAKKKALDERPFPFELPDFGDLLAWSSNRFGTVAIFSKADEPQRVYYWYTVDSGKKRSLRSDYEPQPKRWKKDD